jgi:hypothetical protein
MRSQGLGCTGLQSLVKCLDHRGTIVQHAVMQLQGCVRLRNALISTSKAIFTVMLSRTADLKAAEKIVGSVADC